MAKGVKPWLRQPDETGAQYHGFSFYRDLGPARRLQDAYEKYVADKGLKGAAYGVSSHFTDWSSDNRWVERAEAYDEELQNRSVQLREAAAVAARTVAAEHAEEIVRGLADIARGRVPAVEEGMERVSHSAQIAAAKTLLDIAGINEPQRIEVTGRSRVLAIVTHAEEAKGAEELAEIYHKARLT